MPQCLLVLHALEGLAPPARKSFFDSIFEAAPEHWPLHPGATLVATGLSPAYLRDHLRRALDRAGAPEVLLLVSPLSADPAWAGLPPEGEAWLREVLAEA
jgi:hypothetical protein